MVDVTRLPPKKIDIINKAYSNMRISGLTRPASPEDLVVALDRLEDLAAEWEGSNICIGYNFEAEPDANASSNVHPKYILALSKSLAVTLIPDFNKVVPQTLINEADGLRARASAFSAAENLRMVQPSRRMPRGEVETLKFNRWQRFQRAEAKPPADCETNVMLIGEINDYFEDFNAYLRNSEEIQSFNIVADTGIDIESSELNAIINTRVNYQIKAVSNSQEGGWKQVKITIQTTEGREEIRLVDFLVKSAKTVGGN